MNLGLGNLIELKRYLLAGSLVAGADYDAPITAIGKGVAGWFEHVCNRKFERVVGAVDEFSADRQVWCVQRYPVETITSIEQRDDMNVGYVALVVNNVIMQRNDKSGMLKFGTIQGSHMSQMRVTYTGGYWFDTSENGSGSLPGGATQLPDDIKQAWFTQCAECWNKKDKLGSGIAKGEPATFVAQMLASLDLVPFVQKVLTANVRYQMT